MLLVGHSAGAHLVALLGTNQNYLPSYQLPMNVYKAILPIDTASFDLTIPQEGKLAKLVQKRRDEAFGLEKATLVDASPTLQIRPGLSLSTFVVFATAERPEAVAQGDIFVNTLNENGYRAQNARIDGGHTHRDMNMAIFEKRSPISLTIINFLKK
jgi:acetyl esterase/lipase